ITELIVIFIVILLLFGSKRLPELARGLGKGIREFKRATNEFKNELNIDGTVRDFNKEIKGNLDEVKSDFNKTIHNEPKSIEPKKSDDKSSDVNNKEK